jgi:large subunit ribosomal protein L15
MRPGFEGGQMPVYMRLGKQPGSTSKDAMPVGPHRTYAQGVNVGRLAERFEAGAEVTPEALKAARLIRSTRVDVKILGGGDLGKALTISAHGFSKSAREKIEQAGGSIVWLRGEPVPKKVKKRKAKPVAAEEEEEAAEAAPEAEKAPAAEEAEG